MPKGSHALQSRGSAASLLLFMLSCHLTAASVAVSIGLNSLSTHSPNRLNRPNRHEHVALRTGGIKAASQLPDNPYQVQQEYQQQQQQQQRDEQQQQQQHDRQEEPGQGNNETHAQALAFLLAHLPPQDRSQPLSRQFLNENVDLALAARAANSWAQNVPWEVFLNEVLPYASLDEPRDSWRRHMAATFAPLVAGTVSADEAAMILNREIWEIWGIVFRPNQTPDIMSPSQVIKAGYASCTGLSIFLVDACRSVGIPARIAGTAEWVDDPEGSHTWVEVWDTDTHTWSFTGAAEFTPRGFNRTWFFPLPAAHQLPGTSTRGIYAASYRPVSMDPVGPAFVDPVGPAFAGSFPLAWNPDYRGVPGEDVTQGYLEAAMRATAAMARLSDAAAAAAGDAAAAYGGGDARDVVQWAGSATAEEGPVGLVGALQGD